MSVTMRGDAWRRGRAMMLAAAALSPVMGQVALAAGWGTAAALALAALQAVAVGTALRAALPPAWRAAAALAPMAMLMVAGACMRHSAAAGLLASSGLSHAMVHAGLVAFFASSLTPGRTPLVTRFARRLNPAFHAGMEGYTRGVTVAWSLFFAGQVAASAVLLAAAPGAWQVFVTVLSVPLAVLMALAELAVRRRRFPGGARTGLAGMLRGARSFRALAGPGAIAAPASARPAGDASP